MYLFWSALAVAVMAAASVLLHYYGREIRSTYGETALNAWADKNALKILWAEEKRRRTGTGLFGLMTLNVQTVYYVKTVDRAGFIRYCWVRCPSWFALFGRHADVKWDLDGPSA